VEPLSVVVRRGGVTEARHRVHAVAVRDGRVVLEIGAATLVTHLRSSAKPIQALPLVRARPDLDDTEIAIACASHLASREQLEAVRRLLATARAGEDDLECGPEPTRLEHPCSGKHAGFLALCEARGWPKAGYSLGSHPCQSEVLAEIAAAAGRAVSDLPVGIDGCGVPTVALPLGQLAAAFAGFQRLDGGGRVIDAMRAQAELIRGPGAADTMLMRALPGWFAKIGAEGLLCAGSVDGSGLAVKVEDGELRAVRPALAEIVRRLGHDPGAELGDVPILNSLGRHVGRISTE
jgi:L-asparaginase II